MSIPLVVQCSKCGQRMISEYDTIVSVDPFTTSRIEISLEAQYSMLIIHMLEHISNDLRSIKLSV